MNILLANKFYYLKGGSEKYFFSLKNLLEKSNHTVAVLSTKSPKNKPSGPLTFFIGHDNISELNLRTKIKELPRLFFRREIGSFINKLDDIIPLDLAHLNLINYQLSTSLIDYLYQRNVPIVMTLHEYQLISPNYTLYNPNHDCFKAACEKKFYQCFWHRCYQNSWSKSFLAAMESYFNHWRKVYDKIDALIAPSAYLAQKYKEFGFPPEKIITLPNFLPTENFINLNKIRKKRNYYLYFGRINEEKGVPELIKIFTENKLPLKLAGEDEKNLLHNLPDNIQYLGKLNEKNGQKVLAEAKALIMPSQWPENCPYSALEALALGTPVISSGKGGLPELINSGYNGFRFESFENLKEILKKLEASPSLLKNLQKGAVSSAQHYHQDNYYAKLINIYKNIINSHFS